MKTSSVGIELIKRNEGCKLVAYQDVVGVWTIGYGDTQNVTRGMRITQEEAEERLQRRLREEFEPAVMETIGDSPTTQNQFDAMVSLTWNIGPGRPPGHRLGPAGFKGSSVARFHKQGKYQEAADAFRSWNKAGGRYLAPLAKRREEERALYLSQAPSQSASLILNQNKINEEMEPIDPIVETFLEAAENLQRFLQSQGLYEGKIDRDFGPGSRKALQIYLKGD